jgi:hypothetical protein
VIRPTPSFAPAADFLVSPSARLLRRIGEAASFGVLFAVFLYFPASFSYPTFPNCAYLDDVRSISKVFQLSGFASAAGRIGE